MKNLTFRECVKNQYFGSELHKKDNLEGAWQKRGGDVFEGGWDPDAYSELSEPSYWYNGL